MSASLSISVSNAEQTLREGQVRAVAQWLLLACQDLGLHEDRLLLWHVMRIATKPATVDVSPIMLRVTERIEPSG